MFRKVMLILACVFIVQFLTGCGSDLRPEEKVLVTVNGEAITVADFNRTFSLNFKRDPMFKVTPDTIKYQIDLLIDERLLIQAARKKGLDRTDRFVNTIKNFWEQTLIRDLTALVDKEISNSIVVDDQEVRDFYDKMSGARVFKIIKTTEKDQLAKVVAMDPETIKWQYDVGPVNFIEASPLLKKAFQFPVGRVRAIKENDVYYLIFSVSETSVSLGPVDQLAPEITEKVRDIKKQEAFRDWLGDVRQKADVTTNLKIINDLGRTYE